MLWLLQCHLPLRDDLRNLPEGSLAIGVGLYLLAGAMLCLLVASGLQLLFCCRRKAVLEAEYEVNSSAKCFSLFTVRVLVCELRTKSTSLNRWTMTQPSAVQNECTRVWAAAVQATNCVRLRALSWAA